MLEANIELSIKCQDTAGINGCGDISCSFEQVFVSAKRHCQRVFQEFVTIDPPIDFFYGAIDITTTETNVNNAAAPIFGYDFGDATNTDVNTVDLEMCYEFGSSNIDACPDSEIYFELEVGGLPAIIHDLQPDFNSASWAGNPVAAADVTQFFNADSSKNFIKINAGDAIAGLNCYTITLELDSCVCYPWNYAGAKARVYEECTEVVLVQRYVHAQTFS